jgi:hypothetical protein
MRELAKAASWSLLSDERCFQELYSIVVLYFLDLIMYSRTCSKSSSSSSSSTSSSFGGDSSGSSDGDGKEEGLMLTTSNMMSPIDVQSCLYHCQVIIIDLVHQRRPKTIDQLWSHYIELKVSLQENNSQNKAISSSSTPTTGSLRSLQHVHMSSL